MTDKNTRMARRKRVSEIIEVGYDQAQAVRDIMARNGYQELQTTMDPGMHWRVVEGSTEREEQPE